MFVWFRRKFPVLFVWVLIVLSFMSVTSYIIWPEWYYVTMTRPGTKAAALAAVVTLGLATYLLCTYHERSAKRRKALAEKLQDDALLVSLGYCKKGGSLQVAHPLVVKTFMGKVDLLPYAWQKYPEIPKWQQARTHIYTTWVQLNAVRQNDEGEWELDTTAIGQAEWSALTPVRVAFCIGSYWSITFYGTERPAPRARTTTHRVVYMTAIEPQLLLQLVRREG
jgi:hypothetical protein